jgi:hypothetical protein
MLEKDLINFVITCYNQLSFKNFIKIKDNVILFLIVLNLNVNIKKIYRSEDYSTLKVELNNNCYSYLNILKQLIFKYKLERHIRFYHNNNHLILDLY